jgi:uncharacterized spore protein YtfJ
MNEDVNKIVATSVENQSQGTELLSKLVTAAGPQAVFSMPTVVGDEVIITASAVFISMGYGFGLGGGSAQAAEMPNTDLGSAQGGGGGGGVAIGRPVAVIAIGPQGVRMNGVVDTQKILAGFFKMVTAVFISRTRMQPQLARTTRRFGARRPGEFRRGHRPAGFGRLFTYHRPAARHPPLFARLRVLRPRARPEPVAQHSVTFRRFLPSVRRAAIPAPQPAA